MKSISRVIAEGSGQGSFIAAGCFGRVHQHGQKRVYKVAKLDGTTVWLERCFAIQKRLGIDHPLCEFMPEIFSFRKLGLVGGQQCYEVVMTKYQRITKTAVAGLPRYEDIPMEYYFGSTDEALSIKGRLLKQVNRVIGNNGDDLHSGNILWCERDRRWVVVDPSCISYRMVANSSTVDPVFASAKRVVTQYGPKRRH